MLTCEHAQNLFDAYLDDELSSSMRMELNAHRLRCSSCQRQLTLLESCADVVMRDETAPALSEDFTDRVMAALPTFAKTMTTTTPHTARIYRLFAPVAVAAAAILMVIMIAPPIGDTKEASTDTTEIVSVKPTSENPNAVGGAIVSAHEDNGKITILTVASDPIQPGPITQSTEYAAPLPKVMIDGGLTPTVRSWKQLRADGTMLRDLGKMMLNRAVSDMVGEQVVPAGGAAVESPEDAADADDADHLSGADEDQPL